MEHRLGSSCPWAFSLPPAIAPFTRESSSVLGSFFGTGIPAQALDPGRLLDLPMELLELVLFWAIKIRGVQRGVRLRLVCKTFDIAFYPALFETHLPDDCQGIGTLSWRLNTQQPNIERMWHKYLVFRTMKEENPLIGRYYDLRTVALDCHKEMQKEAEAGVPVPELREVVEQLCWFLLRQGVSLRSDPQSTEFGPNHDAIGTIKADGTILSPGPLTLLSAAAFLNLHSLVQELLDKGHNPEEHGLLFAPAMQAAAQAGNIAMLDRLRRHKLDVQLVGGQISPYVVYGNWAIIGAAIRGDMDVLRNVLAHEVPLVLQLLGGVSGHGLMDRQYASTPAVYDCITNAFPIFYHGEPCRHRELKIYAELGNINMVRHLLDPEEPTEYCQNVLQSACRGNQIDVVSLIIRRPDFDPRWIDLHRVATTTHSLDITRLLLRHGANPNLGISVPTQFSRFRTPNPHDSHQSDDDDDVPLAPWVRAYRAYGASHNDHLVHDGSERDPAIVHAFYRENVQLLRLLIRYGARVPTQLQAALAEKLETEGYDTMRELLARMCYI